MREVLTEYMFCALMRGVITLAGCVSNVIGDNQWWI